MAWTNFPEESVFFFTNQGPLGFLDDNDKVVQIFDWQDVQALYNKPVEVEETVAA